MEFPQHFQTSGEGVPFVFQHGLASHVAQPQALLGGLPHTKLISMDCPGHGQSSLDAEETLSFQRYTDQVIRLLDFLGIERAVWGGISMGSGIAINAALRFPERVQSLVLVRPAWLDSPSPPNLEILLTAADLIPEKEGLEQFNNLDFMRELHQELPKAAQSILGVFAASQSAEMPRVLRSMIMDRPFGDLNEIQKIKVPCLLIANDDDPLHPFETAEKIGRAIEASELTKVTSRYVDGVKHQNEVRQLVEQFLGEAS